MPSYKVKEGLAYRLFNNNLSINKGYRADASRMAYYWHECHPVLMDNSYYAKHYPYVIRLKTTQSKLIRTMLDNTYQIK